MNLFGSIVEKIKIAFNFNRDKSPNIKIVQPASLIPIAANVETQIGQQVNVGLTYSDVKEIMEDFKQQALIELKEEAKKTYANRVEDFNTKLLTQIAALPAEKLNKLREPDVQIVVAEASKISGRKISQETRKVLADLVIGRIVNEGDTGESLKSLVYNEAVNTVGKLTNDGIKILALTFLTRYTSNPSVDSLEKLDWMLTNHFLPLIDFKDTTAEFQHIEYAGAGANNQLFSWNIVSNTFRSEYTFLFQKGLDKEQPKNHNVEDIIGKVAILDTTKGVYNFSAKHKKDLEENLDKEKINGARRATIIQLYESQIKNEDEIKKEVEEKTVNGKKIIEKWNKSQINGLTLTSVGIVIAATFLEQSWKTSLKIDNWIK